MTNIKILIAELAQLKDIECEPSTISYLTRHLMDKINEHYGTEYHSAYMYGGRLYGVNSRHPTAKLIEIKII